MADKVYEFRPKPGDTEKITINLGYVDLRHIDLLVQEGFYSNRTDFISSAPLSVTKSSGTPQSPRSRCPEPCTPARL